MRKWGDRGVRGLRRELSWARRSWPNSRGIAGCPVSASLSGSCGGSGLGGLLVRSRRLPGCGLAAVGQWRS
eukprot:9650672-Alexandrium_andersonii.AAC.1